MLKTLALEPLHGWAVLERLGQMSGRAVQVRQGSLYPALHRPRGGAGFAQDGYSGKQSTRQVLRADLSGPQTIRHRIQAWKRLTTVVSQVLDTP